MSAPRRLFESGSPRVRALVNAGRREAPDERTEAAVLKALGLGAAGWTVMGASSQTVPRARVGQALAWVRRVAFSKVGIGAIAAATAGVAGYGAGRAHGEAIAREAPAVHLVSSTEAPNSLAIPAHPPVPPIAPSPVATPEPPAVIPVVHKAPSREAMAPAMTADAPTTALDSPSIAAQLESIRRARGLVEQGDGTAALAALNAYQAQSPGGAFEEEAMALRVQALRLTGDAVSAAREMTNFRDRFPKSVHLAKLAQ